MKIFTKEILRRLPSIEATANLTIEQSTVQLKLFNPCGGQTWYITAYDPDTNEAFGYVNLIGADCAELGSIDMNELLSARFPPFGLGVERDTSFRPMPLKEVMDTVQAGGHV
jgi:hypothetical protein